MASEPGTGGKKKKGNKKKAHGNASNSLSSTHTLDRNMLSEQLGRAARTGVGQTCTSQARSSQLVDLLHSTGIRTVSAETRLSPARCRHW